MAVTSAFGSSFSASCPGEFVPASSSFFNTRWAAGNQFAFNRNSLKKFFSKPAARRDCYRVRALPRGSRSNGNAGATIEKLNGEFGCLGVKVEEGEGKLPKITLTSNGGSEAVLYLFGGCITSWKIPSGKDLLFIRPDAVFNGQKPIRVDRPGDAREEATADVLPARAGPRLTGRATSRSRGGTALGAGSAGTGPASSYGGGQGGAGSSGAGAGAAGTGAADTGPDDGPAAGSPAGTADSPAGTAGNPAGTAAADDHPPAGAGATETSDEHLPDSEEDRECSAAQIRGLSSGGSETIVTSADYRDEEEQGEHRLPASTAPPP